MFLGNLGVQYFYSCEGSPVNAPLSSFDAPANSIVIDVLDNVVYIKTSPRGNNSGFVTLGSGGGMVPIGINARFIATAAGAILQTSPDGVNWTDSQQWP